MLFLSINPKITSKKGEGLTHRPYIKPEPHAPLHPLGGHPGKCSLAKLCCLSLCDCQIQSSLLPHDNNLTCMGRSPGTMMGHMHVFF